MAGITTAIVAILDEATHSKYRRLVSNSYSMSALKEYEPRIDEVTETWLGVFSKFAEHGEVMDLSLWSHYCPS
jgi:cytochrome P450